MSVSLAPVGDRSQCAGVAVLCRYLPHRVPACPGLAPYVAKAKKGERGPIRFRMRAICSARRGDLMGGTSCVLCRERSCDFLKYAASLEGDNPLVGLDFPPDGSAAPRGPLGPTRLELSKPVIAAMEGPAVAGGMELALWCDLRVMAETAYIGVYCRRWGIPLIDGGTVRLPRLVGQGRALDIILTSRKVTAEECYRIGACERIAPHGRARELAEQLAHEIARFPQACVRSDRMSVVRQHGLPVRKALETEWQTSIGIVTAEGIAGAGRFSAGKGRHGDYINIE